MYISNENKSRIKIISVISIIFVIINLGIILTYNPISVISYIYFLCILLFINKILFKIDVKEIFLSFNIGTFIMLVLLLLQMNSAPEYYGLTPSILGIGADDSFFYSQSTNYFPMNYPIHHRAFLEKNSYSLLLIFMSKPIRYFYKLLPIDLLFINVFALAFLPSLTSKMAELWTGNFKIKKAAYILMLLCPYCMMNGLILIRDGWTAMLLMAGLYFLFKGEYFKMILITGLQFFIRIASGFEMIIVLGIFTIIISNSDVQIKRNLKKIARILLIVSPFIAVAVFVFFKSYIELKLGNNLFLREDFVDDFLSKYDGSILYKIMEMPFYLRIPLGTMFFLLAPFISATVWSSGYFSPKNILSALFGVLNIFYIRYFVNTILVSFKKNNVWIKTTFYVFVFLLLLISQLTMQIRHKTMFMPMYYILVSYGMYNKTKFITMIGIICSIILLIVNIYVLF